MVESRDNMTGTPYVPPVGDVGLAVAGIWADVLGVDRVGARDDFYDFAGTSMNAVSICARLRDELGIEVSPEAVRETASLEDFVKALEASAGADTGVDLLSLFARSVAAYPDEPAVVCGEESITYDELDAWSRALAARLRSVGEAVPRRVGLWAMRSFADYAGYLAILRIGATVVPLSPDFPSERTARICEAAQLDAIIGRDEDGVPESAPTGRPDLPAVTPSPDDVAYILFTSGSTGNPKGVPISHRNVSAYLAHVLDRYALGPGCRLSQTFALTFDPSVFDVFAALSTGATAVLPRPGDLLDPVRYVTEQGITHWFSVPSLISVARQLSKLDASSMPDLRISTFIGEQLTREQAEAWAAAAPRSIVENVYGPTEVTVACTVYQLPADRADWPETDNATIPIGLPHRDTDVAITEDGELLLRGPQRFAGYLQAEDDRGRFLPEDGPGGPITAEHWYRTGDRVQRLDDGCLVHRGRLDTQVKLNGYRMELGEIEAALRADRRVVDCVVLVVDKPGEAPALHAAYSGEWIAPREIIAGLRRTLPDYMVPRRFTRLDDVPRNANGKTDRRAVLRLLEG